MSQNGRIYVIPPVLNFVGKNLGFHMLIVINNYNL